MNIVNVYVGYILAFGVFIWMCFSNKWSVMGAKMIQIYVLLIMLGAFNNISEDLRRIDKTLQQISCKEK